MIKTIVRKERLEMDFCIEAEMNVWVNDREPEKIGNSFVTFHKEHPMFPDDDWHVTIHTSDIPKLLEWVNRFNLSEELA